LVYFEKRCQEPTVAQNAAAERDDDANIDPDLLTEDRALQDADDGDINEDNAPSHRNIDGKDDEDAWTYKPNKFWNFVDDELVKLRKYICENSATTEEQDEQITGYVNNRRLDSCD
jgi:hypothetical protein